MINFYLNNTVLSSNTNIIKQINNQIIYSSKSKNNKQKLMTDSFQLSIQQNSSNDTQSLEDSEFMKFLEDHPDKKLITLIGPPGQGKTQIQNSIINMQKQKNCDDFACQSSISSYPEIKFQCDEDSPYLFVEFENLDYSQDSKINQSMRDLMFHFIFISTCVIYVHHNIRISKGFEDIATKILQQSKTKKITFVEILNKWNGDRVQSYQDLENYQGLFQKTFYLKSLNFRNSQINKDNNLEQFQSQIKELISYIDSLQVNNHSTLETIRMYIRDFDTQIKEKLNHNCIIIKNEPNRLGGANQEVEYDISDPLLGNNNNQPKKSKILILALIIFWIIIYYFPNISQSKKFIITFISIFFYLAFYWRTLFLRYIKKLFRFFEKKLRRY
ncbi:transmembrane protein, putative (macronuclear) [Tetrahymena thermophila SB210]|uniref:Transmembrane protein, putative n=1 Tax=Tetrahymena thermophila (strain SB210) TaxID=312017 RepID=Q22Z63_TETTS|nr:transmembrane protein, putative [Tetrahymena thermophila SB210]EAR90458.2 transmembrane protein, putative [Tetrahymena thermophila SB210]|eukprot:XP_001010703.2 transmembrane protein, putative [Tetrahymena thermophila SB210]